MSWENEIRRQLSPVSRSWFLGAIAGASAGLICVISVAGAAPGEPLVRDARLRGVGLSRLWQSELPLERLDRVEDAYLVDDALYVTTDHGVLFALENRTGLIRWAEKVSQAEFPIRPPTHLMSPDGRGPTVVMASGKITVFDRYSGDRLTTVVPEFTFASAPVGYDRFLFAGTFDGYMRSMLFTADGGLLDRWQVRVGDRITATPLLYGNQKLLFADHTGTVYSCRALDKALDWQFRTGGKVLGDVAVDDSGVYIASADRSMYKIDGSTGTLLWRHRFPCPLLQGPVVAGDTVYQFCEAQGLYALDAASGVERWNLPRGLQHCTSLADRDIILTREQHLLFVDRMTGAVRDELDAAGVATSVSSGDSPTLYLIGERGRVLCARPTGTPMLTGRQVERAKKRLHLPPQRANTVAQPADDNRPKAKAGSGDPFRSRRDLPSKP